MFEKIKDILGRSKDPKDPQKFNARAQTMRIRHDIGSWRCSVIEAESAWNPFRVKMQNIFIDTVLNGHVFACMQRRKNLSLSKGFEFYQGENVSEEITKMFQTKWFNNFLNYVLDAQYYGYSLISFGDIVNNQFPKLSLLKRNHVSPDRMHFTSMPYTLHGWDFAEGDLADWTVYVATESENGVSNCGYGLLYKVAYYEIFLRNNTGWNADFNEIFGQPIIWGKTTKSQGDERDELESGLANIGSSHHVITDINDEIEFVEAKSGKGMETYANFEERMEKKISKILLGHSDALDSTPGKLGTQGNKDDSLSKALKAIEGVDSIFVQHAVNDILIPKMLNLGFKIPLDAKFRFCNNKEKQEERESNDAANKVTADTVKTLKDAGFKVDAKWIEERTGIPVSEAKEIEEKPQPTNSEIQNKLNNLYEFFQETGKGDY